MMRENAIAMLFLCCVSARNQQGGAVILNSKDFTDLQQACMQMTIRVAHLLGIVEVVMLHIIALASSRVVDVCIV